MAGQGWRPEGVEKSHTQIFDTQFDVTVSNRLKLSTDFTVTFHQSRVGIQQLLTHHDP
jgi:hypothetical protein